MLKGVQGGVQGWADQSIGSAIGSVAQQSLGATATAGLLLVVTSATARSWLFRWKVSGKRKEMGLGGLNAVSLAQARDEAAQARADRAQGRDPALARATRKAGAISFGEAADRLIESVEVGWKNAKHRHQWRMTLETFAAPLRPVPLSRVTSEDVRDVLKPIWLAKPETAARLRGRIERVLDWAKAQKYRTGDNARDMARAPRASAAEAAL